MIAALALLALITGAAAVLALAHRRRVAAVRLAQPWSPARGGPSWYPTRRRRSARARTQAQLLAALGVLSLLAALSVLATNLIGLLAALSP